MITLDTASPIPPFEQVRSQLADLIRSGQLAGGHRLPSIRQLAGDLRIAPGTVVRAYNALETDGLIEMSKATGTRVREGLPLDNDLQQAAAQFITAARSRGDIALSDVLGAVRAAWADSTSGAVAGSTG